MKPHKWHAHMEFHIQSALRKGTRPTEFLFSIKEVVSLEAKANFISFRMGSQMWTKLDTAMSCCIFWLHTNTVWANRGRGSKLDVCLKEYDYYIGRIADSIEYLAVPIYQKGNMTVTVMLADQSDPASSRSTPLPLPSHKKKNVYFTGWKAWNSRWSWNVSELPR